MTEPRLRTPRNRTCETCGRVERWDAVETTWKVAEEGGEKRVGSRYCIHEWDINGTFAPFEDEGTGGDAEA